MRTSFLPNLRGLITNGAQLKIQATKALNHAMMYAKRGPGYSPAATALAAFLQAAINANRTYTRADSIASNPLSSTKAAAATTQLAITATYADAGTEVVTTDPRCTYSSSDPTKATVSATGLITHVATGASNITVTYHGRTTVVVATTT